MKYIPGKANVVADAFSRSYSVRDHVQSVTRVPAAAVPCIDNSERDAWLHSLNTDPHTRDILVKLNMGQTVVGYSADSAGILYHQPEGGDRRIVVPSSQRQRILEEHHDVPTAGHLGVERTLEMLQRLYWWKGIRQSVKEYVKTCPKCQMFKTENQAPKGLRQAIPVPTAKWEQITTDLVTDLPESHGFTAVAVFIDRLTKFVIFVPCRKELDAVGYARLFFDNVFRQSGLPRAIISDRDPRFLSRFWQELFRLLGTQLRMSTAYHPETDGQSEVSIRTLENFLRPYVEQHPEEWSTYLPLAEFAVRNAINVSTGYSPFYLMYGQHVEAPVGLLKKKSVDTQVESVDVMVRRMQQILSSAVQQYEQAQKKMVTTANKQRRDVQFQVGDEVVVRTAFLPTTAFAHIPSKIRRRFLGPFKVVKVVSPVAYTIATPSHWRIHPTFHVEKLKKYERSEEFQRAVLTPPDAIEIEGQQEYEVEAVIRHRGTGNRRQYLVAWKGYELHEATWEPEANLSHCQDLLAEYILRQQRQQTVPKPRPRRQRK
jgi:hypothetical protein